MKDNWIQSPINEVTSLIKDGTHGTHKDIPNGIPMLSAKDIVGGKVLIPDDARLISEADFLQIHKSYKLQENDVLLTLVGTIGRVAILRDYSTKFTFQRSVGILRLNERVNSQYAYYYISSERFLKDLIRSMNASAQGGVYLGELGKINISFPKNLPQQRKIAHILSTCDAVIEKTESAIAKYQAIKQGLMHDLFTRGIDIATGKLRPKYEDAKHLYKKSGLGWLPKEWDENVLNKLSTLITDGSHFSPIPQEKGLPIGNVKDMNALGFDYDNCTQILPEIFELLVRQNCSPKIGDVLLSKDGTIGKIIHFKSSRKIVLLSSIAIIRVNELLNSEYLSWVLKSEIFDRELFKLLSGSALKRITLKDINLIKVPYSVNKAEQILISKRLNIIETKIQTEQSALSKYQQLKKGLMQDLLKGKVEVKV